MAVPSAHHEELKNGVGKCSKPMWDGFGMPAGFCDRPAFGRQTEANRKNPDYRFCPGLACPTHGGPKSPYCDFVFDGPPEAEGGRLVEVEDALGNSIKKGEWLRRPDGYWVLRVSEAAPTA